MASLSRVVPMRSACVAKTVLTTTTASKRAIVTALPAAANSTWCLLIIFRAL
ncbi:MAG: hypothetical protein H6814_09215 [Phycisphaeraceae bacterium]|nr:hypothetical protein [Phycisphaeraceae bacterium]